MSGWWGHYSLKCQPVDYSNSPMAMRVGSDHCSINQSIVILQRLSLCRWSISAGGITYQSSQNSLTRSSLYSARRMSTYQRCMSYITAACRSRCGWALSLHRVYINTPTLSILYNSKVLISNVLFSPFTGGHSTFFALLNSFVHIVMYFYYMIAAMGPKYQKFIWWKKYLTTFQMVWKFSSHFNPKLNWSVGQFFFYLL